MTDVKPGVELSEKDKEALRKENIAATSEALRLAAEHRSHEGGEKPLIQAVADSVLDKLKSLPPEPPTAV